MKENIASYLQTVGHDPSYWPVISAKALRGRTRDSRFPGSWRVIGLQRRSSGQMLRTSSLLMNWNRNSFRPCLGGAQYAPSHDLSLTWPLDRFLSVANRRAPVCLPPVFRSTSFPWFASTQIGRM